jgi:hypothetical protein
MERSNARPHSPPRYRLARPLPVAMLSRKLRPTVLDARSETSRLGDGQGGSGTALGERPRGGRGERQADVAWTTWSDAPSTQKP